MPKSPARRAKIRLLIDYALTDLVAPQQKIREQMVKDERERDLAVIESVKRELLDRITDLSNSDLLLSVKSHGDPHA